MTNRDQESKSNASTLWGAAGARLATTTTIITGGGRGIGLRLAEELLGLGGQVVIADLRQDRLDEAVQGLDRFGDRIIALATDVTSGRDTIAVAARAFETFGAIDNLVTCAGAYKAKSPSLEIDRAEWDLIVNSNLLGTFLSAQAVLPYMVEAGSGQIVTIASLAARTSSPFLGAHYTAAKAGVLGLTRHLATEFGPSGIRVNAVAPGTTLGGRVTEITSDAAAAAMAATTPLGHLAAEEDIVAAVIALLSPLTGFVTGATLDVNGGYLTV
jgi:3-oxoacyl-[acyl-carrier protein] reductase